VTLAKCVMIAYARPSQTERVSAHHEGLIIWSGLKIQSGCIWKYTEALTARPTTPYICREATWEH